MSGGANADPPNPNNPKKLPSEQREDKYTKKRKPPNPDEKIQQIEPTKVEPGDLLLPSVRKELEISREKTQNNEARLKLKESQEEQEKIFENASDVEKQGSRFNPETERKADLDRQNPAIKYGVPKSVVKNLNEKKLNFLMDNVKSSQNILLNIKKTVHDINGAIGQRIQKGYKPLYDSNIYQNEGYQNLLNKIDEGAPIDYNTDLVGWSRKGEGAVKVEGPQQVQNYLNNCHDLEKLYIRKHFEFVYLSNVYKKLFYFYIVIFIVFFYYIHSIRPENIETCKEKKLGDYIIPTGFLNNIRKMVIEQDNFLKSFDADKNAPSNKSDSNNNVSNSIGNGSEGNTSEGNTSEDNTSEGKSDVTNLNAVNISNNEGQGGGGADNQQKPPPPPTPPTPPTPAPSQDEMLLSKLRIEFEKLKKETNKKYTLNTKQKLDKIKKKIEEIQEKIKDEQLPKGNTPENTEENTKKNTTQKDSKTYSCIPGDKNEQKNDNYDKHCQIISKQDSQSYDLGINGFISNLRIPKNVEDFFKKDNSIGIGGEAFIGGGLQGGGKPSIINLTPGVPKHNFDKESSEFQNFIQK